jgi:hypothetical protein
MGPRLVKTRIDGVLVYAALFKAMDAVKSSFRIRGRFVGKQARLARVYAPGEKIGISEAIYRIRANFEIFSRL